MPKTTQTRAQRYQKKYTRLYEDEPVSIIEKTHRTVGTRQAEPPYYARSLPQT